MIAIACLIATWHDEHLLAEAVASAAPHVDRVIVLDGAYAGAGARHVASTDDELRAAALAGACVVQIAPAAYFWRGEVEKRNVLLELGRAFVDVAPQGRYALVLDADELLVNGDRLREHVDRCEDKLAPGLARIEPDGSVWWAPSRLFFLGQRTRYRGRSYWLDDDSGRYPLDLSHSKLLERVDDVGGAYVKHRWDERSPARQLVQREWGRELARRDHG